MKEIKMFIDMMEEQKAIMVTINKHFPEYQALKALLDKPVSKMEITSDMILTGVRAANKLLTSGDYSDDDGEYTYLINYDGIKAALEAVFNHIGCQDSHIPPERPLKEPELITSLQYNTSKEISAHPDVSKPEAQENDGWIAHDGIKCPVAHDTLVDILTSGAFQGIETDRILAGTRDWVHEFNREDDGISDYDIIAYRIIPEAKEEKKIAGYAMPGVMAADLMKSNPPPCSHGNTIFTGEEKKEPQKQDLPAHNMNTFIKGGESVLHPLPQKQTLYEYCWDQCARTIDTLTPPEIIELISEYLEKNKIDI